MKDNEIEKYIHDILRKQLQKFRVNSYGLYGILDDVRKRLYCLIKNWRDIDFINALFITVVEEGAFYEPLENEKVGCLIVMGVRNSLLETIASIEYKRFGLKESISDVDVKNVTSSALEYFLKVDLDDLSRRIEFSLDEDFFRDITKKYPVAFKALLELGKCNPKNREKSYEAIESEPYVFDELKLKVDKENVQGLNYESGISENFNDSLIYLLSGIMDGTSKYFYIDSFKYISRNFEKNMKILEYILTHKALFLTSNFYISNTCVSRREKLVRASHGKNFNLEAISSLQEVSVTHKEIINKLLQEE